MCVLLDYSPERLQVMIWMIDCVRKVEAALVVKSKALNFLINDQLEENPQKKSDCIEVYEKMTELFTWLMTSINIFLRHLWSQSPVLGLTEQNVKVHVVNYFSS